MVWYGGAVGGHLYFFPDPNRNKQTTQTNKHTNI